MDETEIEVATHLADALKGFFMGEDFDEDADEPTVRIDDVQVSLEEGTAKIDWTFNVADDEDQDDNEEGDE